MKEAGIEDYDIKDGQVFSRCDVEFPELQFIFSGYDIPLREEDYVQDISADGSRSNCRLRLVSLNAPFHIVGTPLFMDYYVGWVNGLVLYEEVEECRDNFYYTECLSNVEEITFQELPYVQPAPKALPVSRGAPSQSFKVEVIQTNENYREDWQKAARRTGIWTFIIFAGALFAYVWFYPESGIAEEDKVGCTPYLLGAAALIALLVWAS